MAANHINRLHRAEVLRPYLFFMPAFALIVVVSFLPLGYATIQSFFRSDYLKLGEYAGFDNYYRYLIGRNGLHSILNSLVFILGTAAMAVPLGFGVALVLDKPFPLRGLVRTILILPWLVSNLVAGMLWIWLINPHYGLGPHVLKQIGLVMPNIVTNKYAAMFYVVMGMSWASYPLVMVFILGALQTIPREMTEAARIDGASGWQQFWRITFPLVRNTTMLTVVLTVLHAFKNVELIFVMTGGGPGDATETMALRVFQEGFQFFRMGVASAGALMIFLINLVFTLAFRRIFQTEYGA
jgi:multiple sugar transport system permease protein